MTWVPPSGCRELGTSQSDFTLSPLVAPRAHPEQRLPLKAHGNAHFRSAEAIQPLDPWRQGQCEGTFINTVPLSQVTVTATTGTRSAPRAEQSQNSPTSRDPTQDAPLHPRQNRRAWSTDVSRRQRAWRKTHLSSQVITSGQRLCSHKVAQHKATLPRGVRSPLGAAVQPHDSETQTPALLLVNRPGSRGLCPPRPRKRKESLHAPRLPAEFRPDS